MALQKITNFIVLRLGSANEKSFPMILELQMARWLVTFVLLPKIDESTRLQAY